MKEFLKKPFVCTVFSILGLSVSVNAEEGEVQNLKWAGKEPQAETQMINADCGDAQYTISILKERRERPKLMELQRSSIPFSFDVTEQLANLVSEYFWIENFTLLCGASPADHPLYQGNTSNPFKDFSDHDFTGEIRVKISGMHSADTMEAEQDCLAKNGEFDEETWRYVTLTPDSINIYPSIVGTCSFNKRNSE